MTVFTHSADRADVFNAPHPERYPFIIYMGKIMKIGLQTWGSDGDIRPFLALAGGLSSAGHDVTVAYTSVDNKDYTSLSEAMKFKLVKVYEKFDHDNAIEKGEDIIKTKDILKQFIMLFKYFFEPAVEDMYKASIKLCSENDMVIHHAVNHTLLTAADKCNCPRAVLILCPIAIESKYVPPLGLPNLGKWINSLFWRFGDYMLKKKCYPSANILRVSK